MRCVHCGRKIWPTNQYCAGCGASVGVECDECGHANPADARFCGKCSAELKTTLGEPNNRSWLTVANTLASKGGERKRLSVLFADICESTRLIDQLGDPELGMQRLQPTLDVMNRVVSRYDGIVNKSQGDGIMALFGAPRPHEDHAVRACLAALAIQDELAQLGDAEIQTRIGIHTGEVIAQAVQHGLYQTFDAAGPNVHLASRIEHLAEPSTILISKETYAAARQYVQAEPVGSQKVRGIEAPVELYKLKGLLNAPASSVFRSGRRLAPLTGRHEQFAALLAELAYTQKGAGRIVAVVGEAGIGKSRLCYEFAEHCRANGVRVLEARVLSHGKSTPFQPVLELLRDYFDIRGRESPDISRRRVLDKLELLKVPPQTSSVLLQFLGIADPHVPTAKLDPKARKSLLLDFVRTLPQAGPQGAAAVVIIEDLHWIDAASEEFVEALADAVVGTSTLLLVNFRPGFSAHLTQRSFYRQIALPSLSPNESAILLQDQIGNHPSLALIGRNIVARAQGNPFFLEELVNAVVERGDLDGDPGAYKLKGGIDSIPLPSTVQAVIAARIDRLEANSKRVLEVASVVGREIEIPVLQRICGLGEDDIFEALQQLRRAELLYDVPPLTRRCLAFRHPLILEVVYKSLLRTRAREIHSAVANALEALFKDQPEQRASLLAYHLEEAGENLKAAQQNMRAAVWIGANDPSQALRCWKKVRQLLKTQSPSQPIDYMQMMACGQIVNFAWREGLPAAEAVTYFEEAKDFALALKDSRANALIHAAYGRMLANGGSADEYVEKIREAKIIADQGNEVSVQITLKAVLCHALRLAGYMSEALQTNIEAAERVHDIVKIDRETLGFDIEVWLTAMRGQTLVMLDRCDEARPFLDSILQMDSSQVDPLHQLIPSLAYVDLACAEGNAKLAEHHSERAFAIATSGGNPYLRVYAQASRGLAHLVGGRLTSAISDLSDALSFARARKAGLENEPRMLADLANVYRLEGDVTTAFRVVNEAISISVERHARVPECLARIVHAALLIQSKEGHEVARNELTCAQLLIEKTGAALLKRLVKQPGNGVRLDRLAQ
ncbi:adenylate/guanylate cyclase domain-containing protein [Bradyrhizobium sp. RP6]|uniref:adenylate/guanylate cyclase domain-containing protein n=1 Tax=Bradyrhizobium sp. RP6 TaxID=2489596 RepID=UPI000F525937|nr:adenylate/guanylate cyclase domain-containing protein [Bradyrhizobium sp. RP6]RQH12739.1 adenylate/guanylate cyclase domain-containing protein [Bradyrhizobium sp. RP6]